MFKINSLLSKMTALIPFKLADLCTDRLRVMDLFTMCGDYCTLKEVLSFKYSKILTDYGWWVKIDTDKYVWYCPSCAIKKFPDLSKKR